MEDKLSLYQLNKMVSEAISDSLPLTYWVIAEISEIRMNRTGHCYLELVESDEGTNEIIAKSRAVIWSRTYRMIKPYFESAAGRELESGMKILVNVSVDFHELYGFSLSIRDIDPSYTVGDIELRKKEIIQQLTDEGIIDMNKEIPLPDPIQKIAVISSETAAGYGDFIDQLQSNSNGIRFYCKLFPAAMQGAQSEASIMEALDRIYQYENFFDCVAIIRGGGSKSDLSCFDNYDLSYYITQFPLPVITGIGHERDDSIVDVVANTRLKTPTAVAGFIIDRAAEVDNYFDYLQESLDTKIHDRLDEENQRLELAAMSFVPSVKRIIELKNKSLIILAGKYQNAGNQYVRSLLGNLEYLQNKLSSKVENKLAYKSQSLIQYQKLLTIRKNRFLLKKHHELEMFENSNEHLNPEGILKRGYSLTFSNDKLIKNIGSVKVGDTIVTRLAKGSIESSVEKKNRK